MHVQRYLAPMRIASLFVVVVAVSGCSRPITCGIYEYDSVAMTCVCPAGTVTQPDGRCVVADAGVDAGFGSPDALPAVDAEVPNSDALRCGVNDGPCCMLPSPACGVGLVCTVTGCSECGSPGQPCCDTGAPCEAMSCVRGSCPEIAALVQIPRSDGTLYGIDATEVTVSQYGEWLATGPSNSGPLVGTGCASNSEFEVDLACTASGFGCTGAACGNRPQVCVDWCDAFAYCAAAGKSLCGWDRSTINLPASAFSDALTSTWFNACSAGDSAVYGTGESILDEDACNTGSTSLVDVGSLATCQSTVEGFEGVFDLTGNAREWINSCASTSESSECLAVGGSYRDSDDYLLACSFYNVQARNQATPTTGFRCCAAP